MLTKHSIQTRWKPHKISWPLVSLLLLLLINLLFIPSFFALEIRDGQLYGSVVDVLHRGSIGMILALGMTLVVATGGVDLSVGSIMAITGAVAALLLTTSTLSTLLIIPIALIVALLAGSINGLLVTRAGLQPIVATLILMVSGRGIARFITGEKVIGFGNEAHAGSFSFIGNGTLLGLPFTITLAATLFIVTLWVVRKTALGLFIEALGTNEKASHATGIQAQRIKMGVYLFAAFCAGIAGLIDTANIQAADTVNAGIFTELDAIFAVVVGGTALTGGKFNLTGSLIGALLLQTLLTTLYTFGVAADTAPIPKALVILTVCLLQSESVQKRLQQRRHP